VLRQVRVLLNKYSITVMLVVLLLNITACRPVESPAPASVPAFSPSISASPSSPQLSSPPVREYTYRVIKVYPHDTSAFTEGLVFDSGTLYEGTGRYGSSSLRKVDLTTGAVLQNKNLASQYFGEGITVFKNNIIQLTWKSDLGFVYDKDSFNIIRQFSYPHEGWGITQDGERLIMSDGSSTLHFLNPDTFESIGVVKVEDSVEPVTQLNELEYIQGVVYANVWQTDRIVMINPENGEVTGWIDLSGLLQTQNYTGQTDVLNGIAYDSQLDRLFVTGKLWPYLFEIKLAEK
jgi:glutaminyl-peptide cyclotransferase